MPVEPSMTIAHEDTIMVDPSIPTPSETCYLITLPIEIQADIYGRVVKHSDAIKPELWTPRDSIFAHDSVYNGINRGHGGLRYPVRDANGRMPEALSVVDLLKTCRMIRSVVNKFYLFYRPNKFEFSIPVCMLNYLKALSTGRRQAIKDVTVLYDYSRTSHLGPALTVLRTCLSLRHLTIDITLVHNFFEIPWADSFDQTLVYNKLVALHGLESLTITYAEDGSDWDLILSILKKVRYFPVTDHNKNAIRFEIHQPQTKVNALVTLQRPTPTDTLVTAAELTEAMSHSNVVEGDISSQPPPLQPTTTLPTLSFTKYDESGNVSPIVYPVSDEVAAWANDVTPAHWALPAEIQVDEDSSW